MAYRFKLNESAGKALLRTGAEQFRCALESLRDADTTSGIHGTRKSIKRLRALLRLARPGLAKAEYQKLNATLRDAGRALSATRDRDVLLVTMAELSAGSPDLQPTLRRISSTIAPAAETANTKPHTDVIRQARTLLQTAATEWETLELSDDAFPTLAEGLARGLLDVGEAFEATEGGDEEAFHDLRKTVQRHRRHMRLVEAGWPAYFVARADEAKTISELLGKAQDLTLLLRHLGDDGPASVSQDALARLRETVKERRAALQDLARSHTRRLLAEGPRAHARRATEYWTAARTLRKNRIANAVEAPAKEAAAAVSPTSATPPPRIRSPRPRTAAAKRSPGKAQSPRKPA
jgi:CHAD domain-containing protein